MNKIYKSVYQPQTGTYIAVSELGKSYSVGSSACKKLTILGALFAGALSCSFSVAQVSEISNDGSPVVINQSGNITNNSGSAIAVNTSNSSGLSASIDITVSNSVLIANGANARGIDVKENLNNLGAGNLTINVSDTDIKTGGSSQAHGVSVWDETNSGDITFTMTNVNIDASGDNSDGVNIQTKSANNGSNITITTNGGTIKVLDDNGVSNGSNFGIVARHDQSGGSGNVSVTNNGTAITIGYSSTGNSRNSDAINAGVMSTSGSGNVYVINSGTLSTRSEYSYGISAINHGSGETHVTNTGSISTELSRSSGIDILTGGVGIVELTNSGGIATLGDSAHGISVTNNNLTTANGNVILTHTDAEISTAGKTARAISVIKEANTVGGGNTTVIVENANLVTTGFDSQGIRVFNHADDGDITITATNTDIDVGGHNSDGIWAMSDAVGSSTNINITTNGGSITTVDPNEASGGASHGVYAALTGASTGNVVITNNGTDIHTRQINAGDAEISIGLYGEITDTTSTGHITITNDGSVTTDASKSYGIFALNKGSGKSKITNLSTVTTNGDNAHATYISGAKTGILVNDVNGDLSTGGYASHVMFAYETNDASLLNKGNVTATGGFSSGMRVISQDGGSVWIGNAGTVSTSGTNSHALMVEAATSNTGLDVTIINDGLVEVNGVLTRGILVQPTKNATISVINNGTITHASQGSGNYGIDVKALDNSQIFIQNNGLIQGGDFGIVAWSGNAANTNAEATIDITSKGKIESVVYGIAADMSKSNTINIAQGGSINSYGGSIYFREHNSDGQINTLNNAGTIVSERDIAIQGQNLIAGSTLTVNNGGSITGFITSQDEDTTLNNSGRWNLRNFADTNDDHVRDTKAVAVSDFGGGNDIFNNTGILNLSSVTGETTTVTTGEYVPTGASSIANVGIVQGQLLNTDNFTNTGIIDIRGDINATAGNVLVISGGATAGAYGGGTYTSNGGELKLKTALNQGGAASETDMLVVDNLVLGAGGATRISITPTANSVSEATVGSGIQIIETLGTQESGSFVLNAPVTYGSYEYVLFDTDENGVENGYYLRNRAMTDPSDLFINPNIGAYLANQYAAAFMFQQNILDRYDNVRDDDTPVWGRVNYGHVKSDVLNGVQSVKINSYLLQLGADLYENKDKDIVSGVFAGLGESKISNTSNQTGSDADGRVRGVQLGAYLTWRPQDEGKGAFVDLWGYYARYSNSLRGAAQQYGHKNYNSNGYALSAEVGHGFIVKAAENTDWIVEPHAQLTYNYIDADDFYDKNGTRFSGNKSKGFQTRVGARFYGYARGANKLSPFVEANWLHNGVKNSIRVNDEETFRTYIGKNVAELKVGVQGRINERFSTFIHVGGQAGSESFKRGEVQLGVNYNW